MTNEQKDSIIQKCFVISGITTRLARISLLKNIDIETYKKTKVAQEECIEDLIDYIKSLQ